jgi:hypothetical protein
VQPGRPTVAHFAGRAVTAPLAALRVGRLDSWANNPTTHRAVEEVINLGNRSTLRWDLTGEDHEGKALSQHRCSVVEHDGERITKFWAYYPDLAQLVRAILQLQ